jgi:DhnA family fructose-bisphosphate aldolase class Ia
LTGTVEEAVSLGADGISIHINLGGEEEAEMLKALATVSTECSKFGLPLLAMMYIRGGDLDPSNPELLAHAARVADEAGADIVKVNYSGDISSFQSVIEGCKIPVVIAGGAKKDNFAEFLKQVKDALLAGAAGVSIGRNIFQSGNISKQMKQLLEVIRKAKEERDGVIVTPIT